MKDDQIRISVPQDLLQAIANYLGTRPYVEVAGFIQSIQQCRPVNAQADDSAAA